jgi:hypothetical protein
MRRAPLVLGTALLAVMFVRPAAASPLLVNGGFESGLTGWILLDQAGGSGGSFIQSGTTSPLNGFAVPAPIGPTHAIMTDQSGPGSHIFYQDFVVPVGVTSAGLSFEYFVHNYAGSFVNATSLDYTVFPNQQARADIITTSANPFSLVAADVLMALGRTEPGDPLVEAGYVLFTADLSAFLAAHGGETLRLRFAEVDNQGNFNLGIDNVRLDATSAPEPASLVLLGTGIATVIRRATRRA